jgi:hypothetical protein
MLEKVKDKSKPISAKDLRIPFCADIVKCPLEFSAMKIDMPVL